MNPRNVRRRLRRPLAQAAVASAMCIIITWGIVFAVNPADVLDQSSLRSLATDSAGLALVSGWPFYAIYFVGIFAASAIVDRARPARRFWIAVAVTAVAGLIPLVVAASMSGSDAGILALLSFALLYLPFLAAGAIAAGVVYWYILPGRRPAGSAR